MNEIITPTQLAAKMGITPGQLRKIASKEPLPGQFNTPGGHRRFRHTKALQHWIDKRLASKAKSRANTARKKSGAKIGPLTASAGEHSVIKRFRRYIAAQKNTPLTPERARLILQDLGGGETLAFLDKMRAMTAR